MPKILPRLEEKSLTKQPNKEKKNQAKQKKPKQTQTGLPWSKMMWWVIVGCPFCPCLCSWSDVCTLCSHWFPGLPWQAVLGWWEKGSGSQREQFSFLQLTSKISWVNHSWRGSFCSPLGMKKPRAASSSLSEMSKIRWDESYSLLKLALHVHI